MNTEVSLYDKDNIDLLAWPQDEDGAYAKCYLLPLIKDDPRTYIANVYTDMKALTVGDVILPMTLTRSHPENSYVCSPYNHYFRYGQEELRRLNNPVLKAVTQTMLAPLNWSYLNSRFDEAIYVNNWLLSTNLYPQLRVDHIEALSDFLIAQFPQHPLVFRSVDPYGNPELYRSLLRLGYRMVFSRQVYYQDVRDPALMRKKQLKIDLNIYRKTSYRLIDNAQLTDKDIPRLVELYRALYVEKYSHFNPQFTERFFRLALSHRLFTFKAFRQEGRIDAVLGYYSRNGIMTQPIFGYDTCLPQELGLYRLLSLQVLLEGLEKGFLINCSAGVGEFKRLRGGRPVIEYNGVYDRHLPRRRRLPWSVLKKITDWVAIPVIRKYGF